MQTIHPRHILPILILLTIVALVTLLPSLHFMPKVVVWFMDGQRLLELLLLGLVLLHAVIVGINQANITTNGLFPINAVVQSALVTVVGLGVISACLATSPRHGLLEVATFVGLCYLSIFVALQFQENKEVFLKWLIYGLLVSILLYMFSFYVGYITAIINKTSLKWPLPFYGFTNIRHFNQYQTWGLGLIYLPLLCFDLRKNTRILLHVALILWWAMLFYSASRGVTIAWIVSMLASIAVYRKFVWPFLRLQLTGAIAGFCVYYLLFKVAPSLLEFPLLTGTVIRDVTSDRIGLWKIALDLIQNQPIFGVGPMHYAWYSSTNAHPHNSILQFSAEWGLPTTLIISTIVGYGIIVWLKRFNMSKLKADSKLDGNLAIVLFFTLVANTAYSFVDGVIVMPISQVMMFMVIGLMIGHCAYKQLAMRHNKSIFRPIFATFVLVTMMWSTLPEITQGFSGSKKGFSIGHPAIGPRFWREAK